MLDRVPVRVFLDLDPAFIQLWHAEGIDMHLDLHTHFATISDAVGRPGGMIPDCGKDWLLTLPPVVLSEWPFAGAFERRALTSVGHWRGYGSVEHEGVRLGQRAHSVRPLAALPRHSLVPIQVAYATHPDETSDLTALADNGWQLLDAHEVARAIGSVPDVRAGVVRRAGDRQVRVCGDRFGMVQRPQRLLSRERPTGDRPVDGVRATPANGIRTARVRDGRRGRRGSERRRRRLRIAPPGRSPDRRGRARRHPGVVRAARSVAAVSGPPDDVVRNAVATTAGVDLADVRLRRREPYEYASSAVLEQIVVSIGDNERELILKQLSWEGLFGDAVTSKQRWLHDPRREFGVYEMLAGMDVTPTLYGGSTDGDDAWMLVEKAGGVELWQVGELAVWEGVASWLAAFHVRFRGLVDELAERNPALIRYDGSWVERWTRWATEVVERVGDPRARELGAVASRYGDAVVEWAVRTPPVFVHGELYPSNILVQGGRDDVVVRPVDWEMAGIGPGAVDLAALVAGWDPPEREALIAAYERSMSQPDPELRRHVSLARLHLALRWLALTGDWRPPAEHARDWVAEALDSAADLDLHEGTTPPRQHGVSDARILVVNADDFGASEGVNAGIIEAHQTASSRAHRSWCVAQPSKRRPSTRGPAA